MSLNIFHYSIFVQWRLFGVIDPNILFNFGQTSATLNKPPLELHTLRAFCTLFAGNAGFQY